MKSLCCCRQEPDEKEPLLSGESQHVQEPLRNPLRREPFPHEYERREDSRIETQQATTTKSQPDETVVPGVEIKQAGPKKRQGAKPEKDEFHKKLKFKSVGLDDIDSEFTSLASVINPFVETRERVQAARESFENIVNKSICNIDVKKELKDYIKELKKDAKQRNITIYIDKMDGEIKVKTIEGVKPPKLYRDAVQALQNLKSAVSETVKLEPQVQHRIGKCIDRIRQIDPQRDFHKKKKTDVFTLPGKIKKFNKNRKKAQEIPGIVKEFCLYLGRLLTDIVEALPSEKDADKANKKDEDSGEEGNKSSAGEDEPAGKEDVVSDKDEDKSAAGEDEPVNKNDEDSGKDDTKGVPEMFRNLKQEAQNFSALCSEIAHKKSKSSSKVASNS